MEESVALISAYLNQQGFRLNQIIEQTGFDRNKAVVDAKEAINENDKTRKRFEIMAREVFKKFKACLTVEGINNYRHDYDAINLIYKSLRSDREKADISDIIRELHQVVDEAIDTEPNQTQEGASITYDISKIDFDSLRREFKKTDTPKRTTVQSLKAVVEDRLQLMLEQNPMRINLQSHYEDIIEEYNQEKERVTIEKTFEALLEFYEELGEESKRAMRKGLDEETLALFDILAKPKLEKREVKKIKSVAKGLLQRLKQKKLNADSWREKEATRDAVKVAIHNYLYDEKEGLPKTYTPDEITKKSDEVYLHMFRNYSSPEPQIYA